MLCEHYFCFNSVLLFFPCLELNVSSIFLFLASMCQHQKLPKVNALFFYIREFMQMRLETTKRHKKTKWKWMATQKKRDLSSRPELTLNFDMKAKHFSRIIWDCKLLSWKWTVNSMEKCSEPTKKTHEYNASCVRKSTRSFTWTKPYLSNTKKKLNENRRNINGNDYMSILMPQLGINFFFYLPRKCKSKIFSHSGSDA